MKTELRRIILWFGLILVIILAGLCVFGAFIGAERAQRFFNTIPLSICWAAVVLVLTAGIFAFRQLIGGPSLLLIHAGCILILLGSMAASEAGHRIQKQLFGIDKVRTGKIVIYEGRSENQILSQSNILIGHLPFSLFLEDFRIEYYKPENVIITERTGRYWKTGIKEGAEYDLGGDWGKVKIVRLYKNFKLIMQDGAMKPTEGSAEDSNPAVEVEITIPGGKPVTRYVFENFDGHTRPDDRLRLSCEKIVKDYYSDLVILKEGKMIAEKTIEVNHPLHFGGYHFYQNSYDAQNESYTVLSVTSDTGLYMVYAGYVMLAAGLFMRLWLEKLFVKNHTEKTTDGD